MQNTACSIKAEWTNYMEKAESHYLENTASVERGKKDMEEVLQNWWVYTACLLVREHFTMLKMFAENKSKF